MRVQAESTPPFQRDGVIQHVKYSDLHQSNILELPLIFSATSPKTPEGFDFTVCTPFGRDNTPCYINNLPCLQLLEHLNILVKTMMSLFGICSDQRLANTPLTTAPAFSALVLRYEHPDRQDLIGSWGLVQHNVGVYADGAVSSDGVQWKTCFAGFQKDNLVLDNFASLTSANSFIRRYDKMPTDHSQVLYQAWSFPKFCSR